MQLSVLIVAKVSRSACRQALRTGRRRGARGVLEQAHAHDGPRTKSRQVASYHVAACQ